MPVAQFDTSFGNLSPSDFIVTLGNFADSLLTHPFFKDNWVDFLPHPLALKEQLAAYNEAAIAAERDGGKKNLKERDERREVAHRSAVLMGQYVMMRVISENDPTLLDNVKLDVKSRHVPKHFGVKVELVAPTVSLKHGPSETIIVTCSKVPGAGSNEVQICVGDPNAEGAVWRTEGIYKNCRIEVNNLEPGTKVHVRVRCHGTGAPGPFSQVVSIIVL